MKELEILKALEYESIAGMGDQNDHIKALVIELLCENHHYDLAGFQKCYEYHIKNPLKSYKWTYNCQLDANNRVDICDLGFYRLKDEINANDESRLSDQING